ncbi:TetR family transcriptional regulator [Sporosarcina sp. P37]|uniref:TetR/AcrR family transcriptional regulator n=1 Tax=unclassified Sporosarcina TaxID=2647733 RepID=UPI0009BDB4CE|nr:MULTISPECIES: TetR/AcrR family transcriptional regulator [unclassified Sporosarcina]ARD47887.1 transcriptional regulator [Sporosarcina sp. P33]ARK24417.1 TetR family transcriptional regulator [Sporosarcina sp. P37]PID17582.1 TetR/AcrR family transcriptional regulator [Sporosarcina sp. P35]
MKARIMKAFLEEIHEKSMKFTMDDLARRLGISKRTLYQHFSSKTEILDAIIDSTLQEFDEKTALIMQDPQLGLVEKIKRAITVIPKYNDFYNWQILDQMKKTHPAQWERVHAALHEWDELRELIEQGIREGIIANQNVPLLMKLIIDATNSTLDRKFFYENSITVTEALDSIVDILLFGFIKKDDGVKN